MFDRMLLAGLSTVLLLMLSTSAAWTVEEQDAQPGESVQRSLASEDDLATDTAEIAVTPLELDQIKLKRIADAVQPVAPETILIQVGGTYNAEPGPAEPHNNRILFLLQRNDP